MAPTNLQLKVALLLPNIHAEEDDTEYIFISISLYFTFRRRCFRYHDIITTKFRKAADQFANLWQSLVIPSSLKLQTNRLDTQPAHAHQKTIK